MRRAEIEQAVSDYRDQQLYASHTRINGIAWWKRDEFAAKDLAAVEARTETYARSLGEPDDADEPQPPQQPEEQPQTEEPAPTPEPVDVQPVAPAPTVQPGMKAA